MAAFILRRLIQSLGVMLAVGAIAFAMFRFVGDPVNQIVSIDTPQAERARLRAELGLDSPVPVQFGRYLARAARLDFGVSYQFRQPVTGLLAERMPATLELALVSALLSLLVGIPLGVLTALRRDRPVSKLVQALSLVGVSLPTFLIGILLISVFSVGCQGLARGGLAVVEPLCLPSFGRGEVVRLGAWWTTGLLTLDGWRHLALPAVTLALFQMTLVMRLVRSEMLEVLRADHIRFARARGLTNRAVHFGHALRNTLVPVITVVGLQLGSIIAFAIITESVFQWPGMGLLFLKAVQNVDIPIMAAYLMLIGALFVAINLAVDLLYVRVDPRLRTTLGSA